MKTKANSRRKVANQSKGIQKQTKKPIGVKIENKKPKDIKKAMLKAKMNDIKKAIENKKPKDVKKVTEKKKPNDIKKVDENKIPDEVENTDENQKPNSNKNTTKKNSKKSNESIQKAKKIGKSVAEGNVHKRLEAIVQARFNGSRAKAELVANHIPYIKLAMQAMADQSCPVGSGALAVGLVTYLVRQAGGRGEDEPSEMQEALDSQTDKLVLKTSLLLDFAKSLLKRLTPEDECAVPILSFFSVLLPTYTGLCHPIKDELENALKLWLNVAPESWLSDQLARLGDDVMPAADSLGIPGSYRHKALLDTRVGSGCELVGRVWAGLPVTNPAQGYANASEGYAMARGRQIQQLSLTLNGLLDDLLSCVTTTQTFAPAPSQQFPDTLPLQFPPMPRGGEQGEDDTWWSTAPVERVEVCSIRTVRTLQWLRAAVHSVRAKVCVRDVLWPLMRILQVSGRELWAYRSAEVRLLAFLWPSVQREALELLHSATHRFGSAMHPMASTVVQQLSSLLKCVHTSTTAACDPNLTKHAPTNSTTPNITAQQTLVTLAYKCLSALIIHTDDTHSLSLATVQTVIADLTLKVETIEMQDTATNKTIATLSIKKKSKKKGYAIAAPKKMAPVNKPRDGVLLSHVEAAFTRPAPPLSSALTDAALELAGAVLRAAGAEEKGRVDAVSALQEFLLAQCSVLPLNSAHALPSETGRADLRRLASPSLLRLLTTACMPLLPAAPPPTRPALALLVRLRDASPVGELRSACCDGIAAITTHLLNPRVEAYLRRADQAKAELLKLRREQIVSGVTVNKDNAESSDEERAEASESEQEEAVYEEDEMEAEPVVETAVGDYDEEVEIIDDDGVIVKVESSDEEESSEEELLESEEDEVETVDIESSDDEITLVDKADEATSKKRNAEEEDNTSSKKAKADADVGEDKDEDVEEDKDEDVEEDKDEDKEVETAEVQELTIDEMLLDLVE